MHLTVENSLTLEHLNHLEEQGWVQIDIPQLWRSLLSHTQQLEALNQFASAAITDFNILNIRTDITHWIDMDSIHPNEVLFIEKISSIMIQLKDYFRIGLDHFESHYAIYPNGHFYKRHSDQMALNNKRHFSFVYYLNKHWTENDGGSLIGYIDKTTEVKFKITPSSGTFIIFKSDIEHEVMLSHKKRYSVTGWIRSL